MSSDVEPAKKVLLPYLQRADELQKHEPLVAYYCRLYGMERGLKIPVKERTKTTNAILVSLMNQLEKDKKTVQVSPEDNLYVEGFALSVFAKADKQDRAGRADLTTAKTFYAASIFIEVLHQFGPLQPDIEQKQKYAAWKAADIRKALSEGRKPVPGPPGGDEDFVMSPRRSVDSVGSPYDATTRMQHAPSGSFGDVNPTLDGGSKATSSHTSPPDRQDHYIDHTSQQVPQDYAHPGHTQGGYAGAYPGMYHPSSMADPSALSSSTVSPQGSIDQYYNQPHMGHYPEYTQAAASRHGYPNVQGAYPGSNGGSEATYYQSQPQGSYPNAVSYPASAPFSAEYGSFGSANESAGLGRTTSAPLSNTKISTYHPPPDKITEAQKAAKFAVSALAFDDVTTAVSYLKQSLDLLTNPSS
ncbi:hypothetical protein GOP47_0019925 [Adiantum capillus-veneris]|uniref:Uncharacterized protein n=1 Tax=Adiantum capillus-veneris TaxID=13818 RepID=A0A9D4Z8X7_ADICA|nr:hypothetical protein GOP47_0019925 [Adiantum capillus-veneris]